MFFILKEALGLQLFGFESLMTLARCKAKDDGLILTSAGGFHVSGVGQKTQQRRQWEDQRRQKVRLTLHQIL